jgi:hypothetical protein
VKSRDLAWRGIGLAALALAGAIARSPGDGGGATGLIAFLVAISGLVLLVQGKRVPLALRIERSRHRNLPQAIRRRLDRHHSGGQR